jgi:murein biosynthesis integral membrane protein MurJ
MPDASVLSASRTMASGTILSRVTGLLRAALLVTAIGTTVHADIFNVANTIPNSLYILVAGGVFNAVLVPQLVRAIKHDADAGLAYANRIITLGALVLFAVTAVLVSLAPLFLRLVASSYFTDPALAGEKDSLIAFARYCLPQVFFYAMYVLFGQILNARGTFGPMMWTPIANNVVSIAVLAGYLALYGHRSAGAYSSAQELLLGLGSTLGIAVQAILLVPFLRRTGFSISPRFDFRGTGLGHTFRLAKWTVLFVVVNQIAFYVMLSRAAGATASDPSAAGYTVYSSAFLLTQVPHSIITVSVATATIPLISGLAADHRLNELSAELVRSMRLVLAVILPFAVGLAVLGPELATVMFSWGAAVGHTSLLGATIVAFAPGMLMFSVHYMMLRGFYALEDTRTVFVIQCIVAAVNIACAVTLTVLVDARYAAPMLALAYGASYAAGAVVSTRVLSRRLGGLDGAELTRFVARVVAAALPAAGLAAAVLWLLERLGLHESQKADSLVLLVAGGAIGLAAYVALARRMQVTEIGRIVALVAARRSGRTASDMTVITRPTMESEQGSTGTWGERGQGRRDVSTHSVEPGTVLAERYAIEDLLSEEGDVTTWRARDRVLARSVVLQVIPSGSPAAEEMLSAAKSASRVADSRILQVLDAVDDGTLSYVVREWTNGQSLEVVLSEGPMSARRATFLVREVAGAISAAHRIGLRHQRLAPDTIVLTKSSGVKVLGLGTLAALRLDPEEAEDAELADTRDLGRLLYACLTARWPGGTAGPLPAAPTEHGRLLRPRQVRAGVPRPLDVLCDRILGNPPRVGEPMVTVDEVKNGLNAILANDGLNESSTLRIGASEPPSGGLTRPSEAPSLLPREEDATRTTERQESVPLAPRAGTDTSSSIGRTLWWAVVLTLAVGLLLAVLAIAVKLGGSHGSPPAYATSPANTTGGSGSTSPPAAGLTPLRIRGATSFDPPPKGSGDENPAEVPLAIDGNPSTTWNTLTYYGGPRLGGIKPGVGLVLDLGSVETVRGVRLTLVGSPTTLQIRTAPASASVAPRGSANDYALAGSAVNAATNPLVTFQHPVRTRFVLVWLTSLPAVLGGYEGKVAEVQVLG